MQLHGNVEKSCSQEIKFEEFLESQIVFTVIGSLVELMVGGVGVLVPNGCALTMAVKSGK